MRRRRRTSAQGRTGTTRIIECGSVANRDRWSDDRVIASMCLRGDAENRMDELTLSYRIALADPADLPLADCMHRLVALDRSPRPFRRAKTEARRNPFLDESMVLLDDVIQIRRGDSAERVHRTPSTRPWRGGIPHQIQIGLRMRKHPQPQ